MIKRLIAAALLAGAALTPVAHADETGPNEQAIKKVLERYRLSVDSVESSPLKGIYEVVTNDGVVYSNSDGSYFIYGSLIHTTDTDSVNLTERTKAKRNKKLFDEANVQDEMIIYPAKNEKYVVTVFTDTSCGYCSKLHSQMAEYNDLGITIRYLAYPRSGPQAPNFPQMSAIWCEKDKKDAMDKAKRRQFDKTSNQCDDLVKRHLVLGGAVGVTGTPALLLNDGTLMSGYLPPQQLLQMLQNHENS